MEQTAGTALRITDLGIVRDDFRADVIEGLRRPQKEIHSKYFYDQRGSELFEEITRLEEYYPTRTETSIMQSFQENIHAVLGPRALVVEYGSGSSTKTRLLLDRLEEPAAYMPIDISRDHLLDAAQSVADDYPHIEVLPVIGDYTAELHLPEPRMKPDRTIVYFPGSTIGNFERPVAREFLSHVASVCGAGGGLLIGVDLVKDVRILEAAYNDAAGVTAAFNMNLLRRVNRELGADIDLESFEHLAYWNGSVSRMEMHLRSKHAQTICIADEEFDFEAGETIHTENSHKFTIEGFADLAAPSFSQERVWTDEREWFSVQYLTA